MFTDRNILFWCVDPAPDPFEFISKEMIRDCHYFIPLFCIDPSVKEVLSSQREIERLNSDITLDVNALRNKFRSFGSDLLVITGPCEKAIPSLARVLQTNMVVVLSGLMNEGGNQNPISQFYKDRIKKTGELLNMHSIEMKIAVPGAGRVSDFGIAGFPPFPEIEPGILPRDPFLQDRHIFNG